MTNDDPNHLSRIVICLGVLALLSQLLAPSMQTIVEMLIGAPTP